MNIGDLEFITYTFEEALAKRKDLLAEYQTATTAFRIFNGEGDGIGDEQQIIMMDSCNSIGIQKVSMNTVNGL